MLDGKILRCDVTDFLFQANPVSANLIGFDLVVDFDYASHVLAGEFERCLVACFVLNHDQYLVEAAFAEAYEHLHHLVDPGFES